MSKHQFNTITKTQLRNYINNTINDCLNTSDGLRCITIFPNFINAGPIYIDSTFPTYNIGIRGFEVLKIIQKRYSKIYDVKLYVDLQFLQNNFFELDCYDYCEIICISDDYKNYNQEIYMQHYNKFENNLNLTGHTFHILTKDDLKNYSFHIIEEQNALCLWGLDKILKTNASIDISDIIDTNIIDFFYGYKDFNQELNKLTNNLDIALHLHLNNNNSNFELRLEICRKPLDLNYKNFNENDTVNLIFKSIYDKLKNCITQNEQQVMKQNSKLIIYINENHLYKIDREDIAEIFENTNLNQYFSCCKTRFFR